MDINIDASNQNNFKNSSLFNKNDLYEYRTELNSIASTQLSPENNLESNLEKIGQSTLSPKEIYEKYEILDEIYYQPLSPTTVLHIKSYQHPYKEFALKKLDKQMLINDHLRWQAKQEVEIHCSLDHFNIVKAYEYSQDDNEYILLMEYLPKADYLKQKIIQSLTQIKNEEKIKSYLIDILQALQYVHNLGYIHCDIKLQNLFLDTNQIQENKYGKIKLSDFGLINKIDPLTDKAFIRERCGTQGYIAPEVKKCSTINQAVDIWALGIVLYQMCVAYKPTDIKGFKYSEDHEIPFIEQDWIGKSEQLKDFIRQCLQFNPNKRPTATEALNFPFLQQKL